MSKMTIPGTSSLTEFERAPKCSHNTLEDAFERLNRLKARAPLGTVEEVIAMRNQR
jgi:hypothetical protein